MKYFMTLLVLTSTYSNAAVELQVEQGAIGRWVDGHAVQCLYLGKSYDPVDGDCYYPVDMNSRPAYYEIGMITGGQLKKATMEVLTKDCELETIDFPDESYVHLSPEDAQRHWGEQVNVKAVFRTKSSAAKFSLPLTKPADPLPPGDNFGVCREFNGVQKHRHTGVDYPIGMNNNILSVANGTVVLVGDHFFSGKAVYVDHGDGLITMYFHMSETGVEKGQEVKQGDVLGLVGSSGRSTGPHLHVGTRWLNQRINTNLLFDDPQNYPTYQP